MIDGLCNKTGTLDFNEFIKPHALEERIYRMRCVEAWSMVIPWVGISLADIVKRCEPQSSNGNNLIQLVDMICGAIARPYNKPHKAERDYLETIIKHRITSVLEWP